MRLLPGEHFDAQQAGARYLLDLDVDRLLYPFRREAGLPQPTGADGSLHWRRALAGGEFQYAMRGRGQAHRLEIEVIADSAESDGESAAYEVTLDGLPLQRGEHRKSRYGRRLTVRGRLPWRSGDWRMLIRIVAATMVFVAATMFFAVALPVAVPAGVGCRQ